MKKTISLLILAIICIGCANQKTTRNLPNEAENLNCTNDKFQLFPTQNMWNFIKLNTQTGEMWQVQYSINDDKNRVSVALNKTVLVESNDKKVNGRFTLYPTQNMYTFLLLDTIDGRIWQVQWSTEDGNRGIVDRIIDF